MIIWEEKSSWNKPQLNQEDQLVIMITWEEKS